jgi:hypothetical protein
MRKRKEERSECRLTTKAPYKRYAMSRDTTVIPFRQPETIDDPLTEVAREGARRMLAQVLIAGRANLRSLGHDHYDEYRKRLAPSHGDLPGTGVGQPAYRPGRLVPRAYSIELPPYGNAVAGQVEFRGQIIEDQVKCRWHFIEIERKQPDPRGREVPYHASKGLPFERDQTRLEGVVPRGASPFNTLVHWKQFQVASQRRSWRLLPERTSPFPNGFT